MHASENSSMTTLTAYYTSVLVLCTAHWLDLCMLGDLAHWNSLPTGLILETVSLTVFVSSNHDFASYRCKFLRTLLE